MEVHICKNDYEIFNTWQMSVSGHISFSLLLRVNFIIITYWRVPRLLASAFGSASVHAIRIAKLLRLLALSLNADFSRSETKTKE